MKKHFPLVGIVSCAWVALILTGCSHWKSRNTILETKGGSVGIAHVDARPIRVGDRFNVYEIQCGHVKGPVVRTQRYERICERVDMGQAEAIEVQDDHSIKLKALGEFDLEKGQKVEPEID